ncbi:MAG: hypothetical protein ACYSWP_20165 [Planctomycetota bacterium]
MITRTIFGNIREDVYPEIFVNEVDPPIIPEPKGRYPDSRDSGTYLIIPLTSEGVPLLTNDERNELLELLGFELNEPPFPNL